MQKDSVENRITFIEKIFHLYKKLDKFRLKFLEQLIIINDTRRKYFSYCAGLTCNLIHFIHQMKHLKLNISKILLV